MLRWLPGAAFAAVFLCAGTLAAAGDLETAASLARAGQFSDAADAYGRAVAADPGNEAAVLGKAECLLELGKPADAGRVVEAGLLKHPESLALLLERGRAAMDQGEEASRFRERSGEMVDCFKKVQSCIDQITAKDPKHLGARVLKARWTLRQQEIDPSVARKLLEDAIAEAPQDYEASFQMGKFWFWMATRDNKNKELWSRAEESFRAALKIRPESGAAAFDLALAKQWRGAPARDLRLDYEKAAELSPDNDGVLLSLLKLYPEQDRKLQVIERLLERSPSNPTLILNRALLMKAAKQAEQAVAFLKEREAALPDSPRVSLAVGYYYFYIPDVEPGMQAILRAVERCKGVMHREVYDTVDFLAVRSAGGLSADNRDRLWTALWKAFPGELNGPNNAEVWFRDKGGDLEKSIEWCRRALESHPGEVALLNDMGVNYYVKNTKQFDPAKAEEWWMKAMKEAESQKVNHPDLSVGYTNAVDNLVKLMVGEMRWKDLEAFAEAHLKGDPRYDSVLQLAKGRGGSAPASEGGD